MFCYCAHARRLARTLSARYDAALSRSGLTAAQYETLSVIAALGSSSGRVLAQHLVLDKTTLSRNLKPMLDAGLITSTRDETDGRNILYTLTTQGRRTLARAQPLWQQAHDATLEALGSQAAAAQRSLQRISQALQ